MRSRHNVTKQQCMRLGGMAVLAIGMLSFAATDATARRKCTCVLSSGSWNTGVIKNLGVIADFAEIGPLSGAARTCSALCSDKASGQAGVNNLGGVTNACVLLNWVSACVRGYGYLQARGTPDADGTTGKFTCTPPKDAVTEKRCPAGWSNSNQQDGGVITGNDPCKKYAGHITITPVPPNGTAIDTWGFTWGDGIYAWSTQANGGAPITTVITPAQAGSASFSPSC